MCNDNKCSHINGLVSMPMMSVFMLWEIHEHKKYSTQFSWNCFNSLIAEQWCGVGKQMGMRQTPHSFDASKYHTSLIVCFSLILLSQVFQFESYSIIIWDILSSQLISSIWRNCCSMFLLLFFKRIHLISDALISKLKFPNVSWLQLKQLLRTTDKKFQKSGISHNLNVWTRQVTSNEILLLFNILSDLGWSMTVASMQNPFVCFPPR